MLKKIRERLADAAERSEGFTLIELIASMLVLSLVMIGLTGVFISSAKTIGQAKPEIVPSLIVMTARGAGLQGGKLTLTGVAANSIVC